MGNQTSGAGTAGKAPATAPDNNKRLATLEARHTAFAAGLVKLGIATEQQAAAADFNPGVAALAAIEKLKRSVKSHQGVATKAKRLLAEAAERDPGQKAREIGALKDAPLPAAELLALIGKAETVELVASDGRKELLGVPPLKASGPDAFRLLNGQLLLADGTKFHVQSPAPGQRPLSIEGWGLVIDGKLVAYRKRGDGPLTLDRKSVV